MMKTYVIVNLQVEGMHRWEACPFKEVEYLRNFHRHMFHIKAVKDVSHDDRDVEIIMLKREISSYLEAKYYYPALDLCHFGGMSCEMIAKDLVKQFNLEYCEVLEDGENGAAVRKD